MRTTLSLDDDVTSLLQGVMKKRKASLKKVINEALRHGLSQMASPRPVGKPYHTRTVSLGSCLIGSVDDVAEALAVAEGEGYK